MITAILASENIAMMEMRSGYSVLPYVNSGLMNTFNEFSQLVFFLKVKIYTIKLFQFLFKNEVL